ncbi:aminopeptidase [Anaerococcus sp. AGMB09787]|uniref:aminopeptidase n=1 Tax=Anaerococcus sp. AGMB09787 TaxID=2922869 RepID=UPI001FAFD316|nr:aminopeptidase [Anaerococcus sp. AGMB09787]
MENKKSIWQRIDQNTNDEIFEYGERYKAFLDAAKTEREAVTEIIRQAKEKNFISLEEALNKGINKNDKIYYNNKNKSVVLMVVGDDLEEGMNIVGSHLDAPRLDLKPSPVYQDAEMAFAKTHYYGGIKKFQWPTIELALHGYFIDKEGKEVKVAIGEKDDDPVFYINDILPHLGQTQNEKKIGEAIPAESLNIVLGHSSYGIEEDDNLIKVSVLNYLKENYNLDEDDFAIGEFEVVPAAKARDVGFDRAMIAAHGQDDRVCSYANLEAILNTDNPQLTAVGLFVDKEEIGSVGNTSMSAKFFENFLAEILASMDDYSDIKVRRAMARSHVLSADVTAAFDPDHKYAYDELNSALVGHGVTMSKYTGSRGKGGSNDANPEYIARIRDLFNSNDIIWQTGELGKVDQGGGGTIAYILAEYGAEVVDMGTAMLSMHAPVELLSKADAYMTYKAYEAFLNKFTNN